MQSQCAVWIVPVESTDTQHEVGFRFNFWECFTLNCTEIISLLQFIARKNIGMWYPRKHNANPGLNTLRAQKLDPSCLEIFVGIQAFEGLKTFLGIRTLSIYEVFHNIEISNIFWQGACGIFILLPFIWIVTMAEFVYFSAYRALTLEINIWWNEQWY